MNTENAEDAGGLGDERRPARAEGPPGFAAKPRQSISP